MGKGGWNGQTCQSMFCHISENPIRYERFSPGPKKKKNVTLGRNMLFALEQVGSWHPCPPLHLSLLLVELELKCFRVHASLENNGQIICWNPHGKYWICR